MTVGPLESIASEVTSASRAGVMLADPPAGVVVGVRSPWFSGTAASGYRTVRETESGMEGVELMTVETSHDLASVTKAVGTTAAIVRLVSERIIDTDARVDRYLPYFTGGGQDITVRDLLLHRAGLWEWQPLYLQSTGPETAHRYIDNLPLRYRAHEGFHYSDLGFILLGRIVEVASGHSLEAAITELVTEPLGLTSTQYGHPVNNNVATGARDDRVEIAMLDTQEPYPVGHRSDEFAGWRMRPVHGEAADGNTYHVLSGVSGHAGLFSTVPDLLRFAEAFSAYQEHDDLWHPEVAADFFAPGPDEAQAMGFRRYRLALRDESVTVLGHTGFVGCAVGFVPDRNMAMAFASNRLLVEGTAGPGEGLWTDYLAAIGAHIGQLDT